MRAGLLCLEVLLLALPLGAGQAPAKSPEKCSVEGIVLKAATGEPLKKVRVLLHKAEGRDPPYIALSEATGQFALRDLEPGRYRLSVERDAYVRQEYGQRGTNRAGSILSLEPGQRLRDITFRLVAAAVIAGRVFDADGEPLPRANVQALRHVYLQGRRQLAPAGVSPTNDLGEYRIWGLAPGRYLLSAMPPPAMAGTRPGTRRPAKEHDEDYAPTYYPGTADPARAGAIELHAGEEVVRNDFALLLTRTVRIRGRVFNSVTGQPGRGAFLFLAPRESAGPLFLFRNQTFVQDAQGSFELVGATPGAYILAAHWSDAGQDYSVRLPIDVGSTDLEGINLVIAGGVDLAGRYRIEGKTEPNLSDVQVLLRPRDAIPWGWNHATLKADGTFLLRNVPEGAFTIGIAGAIEGFYLRTARAGDEDVLESGLTIARGKAPVALELVFSQTSGRVEGQVLNDEKLPISGAQVVLVPEPARRGRHELFRATTTDQFGRFVLASIAPGEYKLFAWEDTEPGAYLDPEFLRPVEARGEAVRVQESGGYTVELRLIPAPAN